MMIHDKTMGTLLRLIFVCSLLLPFCPTLKALVDESEWVGKIFEYGELTKAKKYANINKRPLLVVCSVSGCGHCADLKTKVIYTPDFEKYITDHKIVACYSNNKNLHARSTAVYQYAGYNVNFSGAPNVYMFEVLDQDWENVNLNSVDRYALDEDQVSPIHNNKGYFLGSYSASNSFMGIKCGSEAGWNPTTFCKQIEAAFPNENGIPLDPPADSGLDKYTTAVDVGLVYNIFEDRAQVTDFYDSIKDMGVYAYTGTETERWFKFTCHTGRRFFCYASNLTESDSSKMTFTVEIYALTDNSTKPKEPALASFAEMTCGYLRNNGFCFDVPTIAGKPTAAYYMRIIGRGASTSQAASFSIKIHETRSNPAVGYLTNPKWSGAEKGKWSMDIEAAMQAACTLGKPLLLYFGGAQWCPKCVCVEHNVLSTDDFADAIKDYYCVNFDYRPRSAADSNGPCLLSEMDGYRTANPTITDRDVVSKLADNRAWQESLAIPGTPVKVGWKNGSIPYPSLVLCRVIETTRGSYTLDPVGRYPYYGNDTEPDYVGMTVDEVTDNLAILQDLYEVGYSESSAYMGSTVILDEDEDATIGYVSSQNDFWASFDIDGTSWSFYIQSDEADEGAIATISIYDLQGANRYFQTSGNLREGIPFMFTPKDTEKAMVWLCIQVSGQSAMVPVRIQYTMANVTANVSLDSPTIAVQHTCDTVQIPVSVTVLQDNAESLVFQYRVIASETDPLPTAYFPCSTAWSEMDALTTSTIDVDLDVPDAVSWTGFKRFVVEIRQKEDSTCVVGENSMTTVLVATSPLFLPEAKGQTSYTFYKGIYSSLSLPICPADGVSFDISPLPDGLSARLDNAQVLIEGTPEEISASPWDITISLKAGTTVTDTVEFSMNIEELSMPALERSAFIAPLIKNGSTTTSIDGTICLKKSDDGSFDLSLNALDTIATADGLKWSYSVSQNKLFMNADLSDGSTVSAVVGPEGLGQVEVLNSDDLQTYTGTLYPVVSDNPEQYKGLYNVAIRPANDNTGKTIGWIQLAVAEDATVQMFLNLYGTDEFEIQACIYKDPNFVFPRIAFFRPLFGNQQDGYQGKICGVLDITPEEERDFDKRSAWVSACGDLDSQYLDEVGILNTLSPCGTLFTPGESIESQIGTASFLFIADQVDDGTVLVPTNIPLKERFDSDIDVLTPLFKGIYTDNFSKLTINPQTGRFDLKMNILAPGTEDQELVQMPIDAWGIMVPTSSDCCGVEENLAVAYGYFNYEGQIYNVRIFPDIDYEPTPLEIDDDYYDNGTSIKVTCGEYERPARIFYQRMDNGKLFCTVPEKTFHTLTLDNTTPWLISALSNVTTKHYTESAVVSIANTKGTKTFTYSINSEEDAYRLRYGWNLIAIPENLAIAQKNQQIPKLLEYDETARSYSYAEDIIPGRAYWLYVKENTASEFTFRATEIQVFTPEEIPIGWSLRCASAWMTDDVSSVWLFDRATQQYHQPESIDELDPSTPTPVFIYKDPDEGR